MNTHALGVRAYSRVLDVLADRATSALGAARIRQLEPRRDIEWMETEQRRVVAMRAVVTSDDGWHPEPIPDLAVSLGSDWKPTIYGLTGILIAHVFFNMPLAVRLLLPAWATVPPESWRLAAQLGMSSRQIFRLIELPLLRQYAPAAFVFVFILCFLSFAVVLTLGGGPRATTLEVAIYQALRLDVDLPRGGALALLQTVACLVLVAVAWAAGRRLAAGRNSPRRTRWRRLRRQQT